jgi:hypothetical protein
MKSGLFFFTVSVLLSMTACQKDNIYSSNDESGRQLTATAGDRGGCPAPTGLKVLHITTTTVQLTWNQAPGVDGYRVEYFKKGINSQGLIMEKNAPANQVTLTGLQAGTVYAYRVSPVCETLIGNATKWAQVKTSSVPVDSDPASF